MSELVKRMLAGMYVDPNSVQMQNTINDYARALDYGTIQRPGTFSPTGGRLGIGDKEQALWDAVMGLSGGINFSSKMRDVAKSTKPVGRRLRDRYWLELYDASGRKDVSRIKITPERARRAKELLQYGPFGKENSKVMGDMLSFGKTEQMGLAEEFARQALREGEKVRFKIPDGPMGSLYVRVGDRGTIRFSDHAPPPGGVGGYSEKLGRRHGPATKSVHPGGETLQGVLDWLLSR